MLGLRGGLPTGEIRRIEIVLPGNPHEREQYVAPRITTANELAIRRALEAAEVEFIEENGGGPGVRLRKR